MLLLRSLARKYYKWKYPNNLTHMAVVKPGFSLRRNRELNGGYEVIWRGTQVAVTKPLSALRNFVGRDCYIVATGPSIQDVDFSILSDKTLWGVNGAIALSEKYPLKFACYTIVDSDFVKQHFAMVRKILLSGTQCLLSFCNLSLICEREPELLRDANLFVLEDLNERYAEPSMNCAEFDIWAEQQPELLLPKSAVRMLDRVGFSQDITKGIFSGGTVVYGALQAAYYAGCKKVFILGMDLGFSGQQPRFYVEGKNRCHSSLDKYYATVIQPSFELLAEFCKTHDFKVYNLSLNSRLPGEIIPKTHFGKTT